MRCSAKASLDPSGLILGHIWSCLLLVNGDSAPVFRSSTQTLYVPRRFDRNASLALSAVSDGYISKAGSRVTLFRSPETLPSFEATGTSPMSAFSVCLAKATRPCCAAYGLISQLFPE